jgi:HPt (histidine-containing phosphotransfer) domain-containing protein
MDDEDLVREIIEGFLADVPRQVSELKRHVDAGDVRSAAGQAHGIKGAAANVGGMALSAVAQAMEKAGNASRAQEVAALVPELERQLDLLREEMLRSAS